jgi:hypothetical protein
MIEDNFENADLCYLFNPVLQIGQLWVGLSALKFKGEN